MNVKKKNQFIKCPKCGEIVSIQGIPGENKEVLCPKCDFRGSFEFPNSEKNINDNNKLLGKIINLSISHPGKTLLVFFVITFLFLIPTSQLVIDSSMEGIIGDDMPDEIQKFTEISELFGEQELVTVVVDATDSNNEIAIGYLEDLSLELEKYSYYKDIKYGQSKNFAGNQSILYFPEEYFYFLTDSKASIESVQENYTLLMNTVNQTEYFVSENGNIYLLNLILNVAIDSMEIRVDVIDTVKNSIALVKNSNPSYSSLEVGYTGSMVVMDYEGDQMAMDDMAKAFIVTFVFILILLFVSFRSLSLPALSLIPLVCGIIITAGFIYLLYGSLSIMSAVFAVLLMGLGIDFCIHLLTRFIEEMEVSDDVQKAFRKTSVNTGKAIILGTLTTATAFGVLLFSKIKGMHEMGAVLAIGLIVTLICVFFILPALVTIRLRYGKLRSKIHNRAKFKILGSIGRITSRFAIVFLIIFILIGIFLTYSATNVEMEGDMQKLQPKTVPAYKQLEKVKENFNYTEDYLICVTDSYDKLVEQVALFEKNPEIMKVESVLSYMPQNQIGVLELFDNVKSVNPEFLDISWLDVNEMTWEDLPNDVLKNWVYSNSDEDLFLIRMAAWGNIWDEEYREELIDDLEEINPNIVGRAIMIPELVDMMGDDVIKVTIFAGIPIFIIVFIGFRKKTPVYALLALLPVAFGIIGLLGISGPLGIGLNMTSIMMIPLVIGIGIDNGIHILHRYKEEGRGSISRVVQNTGKAIFLTTATTCLAFSSFLIAEHPGMRSLGQVPILGLILCLIAAIIFLPAFISVILDKLKNN
jgi:predicted RND superfamily exporter protein